MFELTYLPTYEGPEPSYPGWQPPANSTHMRPEIRDGQTRLAALRSLDPPNDGA